MYIAQTFPDYGTSLVFKYEIKLINITLFLETKKHLLLYYFITTHPMQHVQHSIDHLRTCFSNLLVICVIIVAIYLFYSPQLAIYIQEKD